MTGLYTTTTYMILLYNFLHNSNPVILVQLAPACRYTCFTCLVCLAGVQEVSGRDSLEGEVQEIQATDTTQNMH